MNEKEIINELTKIKEIADFDYSKLCREYPFVKEHVARGDSIYPAIAGIMKSELEILINRIERDEFR